MKIILKESIRALFVTIFFFGGLYLGIWVFFVEGLTDLIIQLKSSSVDTETLSWSIARLLFCPAPIFIGFVLSIFTYES